MGLNEISIGIEYPNEKWNAETMIELHHFGLQRWREDCSPLINSISMKSDHMMKAWIFGVVRI